EGSRHPGGQLRSGDREAVLRQGVRGRLGKHHQDEPAVRAADEEALQPLVRAYALLLQAFAYIAAVLVGAMALAVTLDVVGRNLGWSNTGRVVAIRSGAGLIHAACDRVRAATARMTWWISALVLFGLLTVLFLTGLAAAFAFFGINIVGAWIYLGKEAGLIQLIRNGIVSITSFSLTPIPFFILMGEVLFHTGVAMKAIDAIDRLIWRVPGRLSVVAVVAGTIFSAISGSTIATTALLGSLLLPQMLKRGYHPN